MHEVFSVLSKVIVAVVESEQWSWVEYCLVGVLVKQRACCLGNHVPLALEMHALLFLKIVGRLLLNLYKTKVQGLTKF